jgi:Ca2+:H+ antiporter
MVAGGIGRDRQFFDRTASSAQSSMLLLAAAAFTMPAVYELVTHGSLPGAHDEIINFGSKVENLSLAIALVLIAAYAASLLFSLRTHRALFNPPHDEPEDGAEEPWTVRRSVAMLCVAGIAVGVMSEILVGSIHHAAESAGLSEFFIGAIGVAIGGNAAEHWVAVLVAMKNKMDLAVNIAIGSSAQIALFVAPVLVVASFFIGPGPMPFVLNGFELAAILLAAIIANQVTAEGESTWFEGVLLLAVYVVFALAFVFA